MRLRTLGAVCATCAAAAPSPAMAAEPAAPAPATAPTLPPTGGAPSPLAPPLAPVAAALPTPKPHRATPIKDRLVNRNVALKQRHMTLLGDRLTLSERRHRREILHYFTLAEMRHKNRRLARDIRELRARIAPPVPPHLAAIARCESGGNPRAISAGGTYRGKYQFSFATWRSVGGKGDPAQASEAEQDRRAAILYKRDGPGQWPVCGR
jgi:soluble lytic murein transglycosylase-like protein